MFECSHIKLHLWLQAAFLMISGKKPISACQLHRILGITYKSTWFMSHRLREAMRVPMRPPQSRTDKVADNRLGGRSRPPDAVHFAILADPAGLRGFDETLPGAGDQRSQQDGT